MYELEDTITGETRTMKYEYDILIGGCVKRVTITDTPYELRVDLEDMILFRQWKSKDRELEK